MIDQKITAPSPPVQDSDEVIYETCGTSAISVAYHTKKASRIGVLSPHHTRINIVKEFQRTPVKHQKGSMDSTESEKSECYYFASLFAKCDPQESGLVKVSVLLNTLRELQALAEDSSVADDGANGSLLELKQELDPKDEDPEITLSKFVEGMTSYLQKNNEWSANDDDDNGPFPEDTENEPKVVVERAGVELAENLETDLLRTQMSDLRLQLQKVTDDNVLLRNHATVAQEENCTIIQALDKKALELKSQAERIKRLEREMDDKTEIICSLEGRNAALCNKFSQLGNELSAFHKERKKLTSENGQLKEEVKKSLQLLTSKDELLNKMTIEAKLAEAQWQNREKSLNDRIKTLNHSIDELNQKVEELEVDYSKLKQSKMEKIVQQTVMSCADEFAAVDGPLLQQPVSTAAHHHPTATHSDPYTREHFDDFFRTFNPTDDIETELAEAGETQQLPVRRCAVERYDVATQCETEIMNPDQGLEKIPPSCPNCCQAVESFGSRSSSSINGYELVRPRLNDQYVVAEYMPEQGCNENGGWEEFWRWSQERILTKLLTTTSRKSAWCLLIVIIFGLAVFKPIDDGCITNPSLFRDVVSYFKYCGRLSHDQVPII